jgi:hypothetical protein
MTKTFTMLSVLSAMILTSMASTESPYFLSFHHPTVDLRTTCAEEFGMVRNAIFKDYVNDLIATSTMNTSVANKLDSTWFYPYTFPESNTTNVRRLPCYLSLCRLSILIIIARGCCDFCNKPCRRRHLEEKDGSIKTPRQLQSTMLDVEVVRSTDTGFVIVKSEGNSTILDSSVATGQGTGIAQEFYATVQKHFDATNDCRSILLGTHYKIMEMKVVSL